MANPRVFDVMTDVRPGLRVLLLVAALHAATIVFLADAPASDRDTPAYRIYVDPETGRYTTTPPAQRDISVAPPLTGTTAGTVESGPAGTDLRRPFSAAGILVLLAIASLLARRLDRSAPPRPESQT